MTITTTTITNTRRYIRESALEARIAAIVEPVAEGLGYDVVRVRVTNENGCTLQIMAEDETGQFTITDCELLHRDLSPVLDLEDPIDREYHLEISSPGVDRPLVRARDFAAWIGFEAKVELGELIDGRKRFRGEIAGADDATISILLPDVPKGEDPLRVIPITALADAKLVMTDKLIDEARARLGDALGYDEDDPGIETLIDEDDQDDDIADGDDADDANN